MPSPPRLRDGAPGDRSGSSCPKWLRTDYSTLQRFAAILKQLSSLWLPGLSRPLRLFFDIGRPSGASRCDPQSDTFPNF
jgi:hypothetical protein